MRKREFHTAFASRRPIPDRLWHELSSRGMPPVGHALDVGAGNGLGTRPLLGRGWSVTRVEPDAALCREAEAMDAAQGHAAGAAGRVKTLAQPIEQADLPPSTFDLVLVSQAWHWLGRTTWGGRGCVARALRRATREGGLVCVVHNDFIATCASGVVARSLGLIRDLNPAFADWQRLAQGTGVYAQWSEDLRAGGLTAIETFSFDYAETYTAEQWVSRLVGSPYVGLGPEEDLSHFREQVRGLFGPGEEVITVTHHLHATLGRAAGRAPG